MPKIKWDEIGDRLYEAGVKKVVLYPMDAKGAYEAGVAWNGVTAITESPSGAEATPLYADDIKYLELRSAEEFGATIEAYTYPDEFAACDGSAELIPGVKLGQQTRKTFGLAYVTTVGNDTEGDQHGYKIHLVYGATAAPSEKAYSTINDNPEAITFSWELTTTPVSVEGFKPTAHIELESTVLGKDKMAAIEALLYGTESESAKLPLPNEIKTALEAVQETPANTEQE